MLLRVAIMAAVVLLALSARAQVTDELTAMRVEEHGRLLLPMRTIFEALGWQVEWRGRDRAILATRGEASLTLWVDRREALVNGERRALEVPPRVLAESAYVPLRFVAEATGASVDYQGRQVTIQDPDGRTLIVHLQEPV